jgi:hypothetical protein
MKRRMTDSQMADRRKQTTYQCRWSPRLYRWLLLAFIGTSVGSPSIASDLLKKDWRNDPQVVKIRNIYASIKEDIKQGNVTLFHRQFVDAKCALQRMELGLTKTVRVRFFKKTQKVRGQTISIEYYYDANNRLRFVYVYDNKYPEEGDRVYYDAEEDILFAVERKAGKEYLVSSRNTLYIKDSEIGGYLSEAGALQEFRIVSGCKESP